MQYTEKIAYLCTSKLIIKNKNKSWNLLSLNKISMKSSTTTPF